MDEVKLGPSISVHDEYSQETLGLFDARVGHLYEDICILVEVHHQLLFLLHLSEGVFVDHMCVVEEQIVL